MPMRLGVGIIDDPKLGAIGRHVLVVEVRRSAQLRAILQPAGRSILRLRAPHPKDGFAIINQKITSTPMKAGQPSQNHQRAAW